MADIEETQLPGVGVRHDFVTRAGDRLGVITHRTGRRELLVYDREDPDACAAITRLEEDDAHALSELLGGSQVTQRTYDALHQDIDGLTIDWVPIEIADDCAGRSIRDIDLGARTGTSLVAVVREGETIASPGADFLLAKGDTVVLVGTAESVQQAITLLRRG
jgi:TrkA domain protein